MKAKAIFGVLLALLTTVSAVMAGPVVSYQLGGTGASTGITYTTAQFAPLVFLNSNWGGRVLFDDPYGFYENGNIQCRPNNYAFTGEQIQWRVLVWDKNGVPEKLRDVYAGWKNQTNGPVDPDQQVNCQSVNYCQDGDDLATCGYPNVRRPNDQESQLYFNDETMGEYVCTLTIEPGCHGQKWVGVVAEDLEGLNGTMVEAESWFCNPELDLYVSGTLDFGELGPGEQSAATFSVENAAEQGSGVQIVLAISGTDFYDPNPSGGMCPTTNSLRLQGVTGDITPPYSTGFWYSAVMGNEQVGPKRIPYGKDDITKSDPIFSNGFGWQGNWQGPFAGPPHLMTPGSEATITLHLGLPQPCNGEFTDGSIYLYAWAI